MSHATAINQPFSKAPPRRILKGDKAKPEAAEHIIEFPGGAIEVARCEDGTYWAHIIVNRDYALEDMMPGTRGRLGEVVDSRVDWEGRGAQAIPGLPDGAALTQVAVRIRPVVDRG